MKFVAFERKTQGTGASRRLRNAGKVPAVVYGGEEPALMVELDHNALWHALKKEAFHSSVLEMELNGKSNKVLLRDFQVHPYRQQVLHVDFQRVSATQKIHMKVPVHFVGAEESPAVKLDKCLVNHIVNELDISCLAADLPESITLDLSKLEKNTTLTLKDIALPKGVEAVLHGHKAEEVVLVSTTVPAGEKSAEGAAE